MAEEVSINIMDAFVAMKKYISSNLIEQKFINNLVLEDHDKINELEKSFRRFDEKKKINEIYFNGQIYDAYSKIIEIFKEAKQELIIIDAYADKTTLDIIRNFNIEVTLIVKKNSLLSTLDIEKYQKQYNNLKIIYSNHYHDRYFIIDERIVYHCGTSINNAGNKTFSINLITDQEINKSIIDKVIENICE